MIAAGVRPDGLIPPAGAPRTSTVLDESSGRRRTSDHTSQTFSTGWSTTTVLENEAMDPPFPRVAGSTTAVGIDVVARATPRGISGRELTAP